MYYVNTQGIDEHAINAHYYYYVLHPLLILLCFMPSQPVPVISWSRCIGNYAVLCGERGMWCGCGEGEGGGVSAKPHRLKRCEKVEKKI